MCLLNQENSFSMFGQVHEHFTVRVVCGHANAQMRLKRYEWS